MSEVTIERMGSATTIIGDNYRAEVVPERLLVVLRQADGFYYGMSMLSAIDGPGKRDVAAVSPALSLDRRGDGSVTLTISCDSNIWDKKIHRYTFKPDAVEYCTEVFGAGEIERCYYFRGRTGEDELASIPGFNSIFSPQANFLDRRDVHVSEFHAVTAGNYHEFCDKFWGSALHGAPLCFVFHNDNRAPFLSVGLLTQPGENLFYAYEVNYLSEEERGRINDSIIGTQALSLKYDGHLKVSGQWRSPRLIMRFTDQKLGALRRYLQDLEEFGGSVQRRFPYESWTRRPVFCTWHEQVALGIREIASNNLGFAETEANRYYFDALNQKSVSHWLKLLAAHRINPGSIILDAKWQIHNGDSYADTSKFPDLRGFIDECHARGIRVILWINAWDREGIPDDECCLIDGKAAKVDPTNSAYRRRVAAMMRRLLSNEAGCYNADGFKVDGTTAPPEGRSVQTCGSLYGFELSRALYELFYHEAKKAKSDCAIGLFSASPYFADLCDFARTGDLYSVQGDPNSTNAFRIQMQELVMPAVAKDTDGALRFNSLLPNEAVLRCQEEIGVPTIYQAEHLLQRRQFAVPQLSPIDDDLYREIADSWRRYAESNAVAIDDNPGQK